MKTLAKSVAYKALDVYTGGRGVRRRIGGEPIRFPTRWCRYYPADYEPATFAFLRAHCRKGTTALDIGAHIGLFSVLMARLVGPTGHVFSFEPTPYTREILKETIRLNGYGKVAKALGMAVARETGEATFYDTGDIGSNANSLVHTQRSGHGYSVPTTSIDEFLAANSLTSQCLKIDAEGAEQDVLLGASKTFSTYRPATLLSLHPAALQQSGGALREVWHLLQKYRMSVFYFQRPVDERWFCQQQEIFDVELLPSP